MDVALSSGHVIPTLPSSTSLLRDTPLPRTQYGYSTLSRVSMQRANLSLQTIELLQILDQVSTYQKQPVSQMEKGGYQALAFLSKQNLIILYNVTASYFLVYEYKTFHSSFYFASVKITNRSIQKNVKLQIHQHSPHIPWPLHFRKLNTYQHSTSITFSTYPPQPVLAQSDQLLHQSEPRRTSESFRLIAR